MSKAALLSSSSSSTLPRLTGLRWCSGGRASPLLLPSRRLLPHQQQQAAAPFSFSSSSSSSCSPSASCSRRLSSSSSSPSSRFATTTTTTSPRTRTTAAAAAPPTSSSSSRATRTTTMIPPHIQTTCRHLSASTRPADAATAHSPHAQAAAAAGEAAAAAASASSTSANNADLVAKLKEEISARDKRIAELQDEYRRALADMENIRARTKKEVAEAGVYSITKFAKDLLETSDVLQRALASVPADNGGGSSSSNSNSSSSSSSPSSSAKALAELATGVRLTRAALLQTFRRFEIEEVNPVGQAFDPNLHEALFQAPVPGKEPGTVFDCQKTGFLLKGRVLRPAQVGVVMDTR